MLVFWRQYLTYYRCMMCYRNDLVVWSLLLANELYLIFQPLDIDLVFRHMVCH